MPVTWLHISDFHIRGGDPYDRDVVLRALVKSVQDFREHGRVPDVIFATGDVASTGKAQEYTLATTFFDGLLAAAALDRRHLFVVPGNHDVDRDQGFSLIRTLTSSEDADRYFNPTTPKHHLTLKQEAFLKWYNKYFEGIRTFPEDSTCGPVEMIDIRGITMGILPLNSALFCQDDDDHEKLWIGRRCLDAALVRLQTLSAQINVALLHHPLDWLNSLERSNIRTALHRHVNCILRGHLHETEVESVVGPSGGALHIAAGAAYQTRSWPNRALYATLERDHLTVFPIRYEDQPQEVWTVDPSLFPREPNYEKRFPIQRLDIQEGKPKHLPPDSSKLLDVLKKSHEETQGTLERLEQRVVEAGHTQEQLLQVHTRRQEGLYAETQQAVIAQLESFKAQLFARLPLDSIETSPLVQEKIAHAKVDNARDLLQTGQARAAQHLLERLRSDMAQQQLSLHLQFRIATNLGGCALHFDDLTTAKAEFSLALTLQPDDAKALVNAAQIALLDAEPQEALRLSTRARQRDPNDPHNTSLYLQAIYAVQPEQLAQLLRDEPWIMQSVPCCEALGQIRYNEGRYQEAEDFLRIALQDEPDNAQILMLLAQVLIAPLQQTLRGDPPLAWRIPEEIRERSNEVEYLLTRAVTALEGFDNRRPFRTALSNRAATRIMRGAWDDALKNCDRVLADNPTHSQAQLHRGLVLLQLDKPAEAARCFEQIQTQDESDASVIPCAQAYYASDQPSKVITRLLPQWHPLPEDHRQIAIAHLLLMAYDQIKNVTAQEGILDALATTWPHDPDALAIVAFQRNRAGRGDEAIGLLQEAIAYATTPSQRERITLEIAQCYFTHGHYVEAAQAWATIVALSPECPVAEHYLAALYNAGAYRDALQGAQRLRDAGVQRPLIIEIAAAVLEYIGDVKQARALYDQLLCLEPTNVAHRVHRACLTFRCGERDAAREVLTQIPFEEIKEHPSLLVQVAQLRVMLRMNGILPLVYQARRLDFENPQTLLAYVSMFLGREEQDAALLTPCAIGVDCTVTLQHGNETLRYTLLDEKTVPRDSSELPPTGALAQKLMSHHKGDQIVWESGPQDLTYEVLDVQSKYVAAFQETLKEFAPRFPDNHALRRVEVPENDPSTILTVIDAHHRQTTQLQTLYTRERWPLGAIASLAGCSLFDIWAGLVNQRDVHVFVAGGSIEDRRQERAVLARTNEVVLDLTALMTLWHLGLHERVARRFQKVFVAQAVLDDLNKELMWHYLHGKPSMAVGKEGDRYVYHKVSPETVSQRQDLFENLRHFVESTTEVVPVPSALDMERGNFENMKDLFGDGASASMLVAKGRGIPLYADDWGLRQIAQNDWHVEGIWSQPILAEMREGGLLTENEYHEAVRWLVSAKYDFVTLDHKDLLWILQQNAMQISEEVTHVFARLEGPECDEASAVRVLADLIKAVWLEPLTDDQKCLILDLTLSTLTAGRNSRHVIANLTIILEDKFILLPLYWPVVWQNINIWRQQKLL